MNRGGTMQPDEYISQILQDLAAIKTQLNDITKIKDDVDKLKEKVTILQTKDVEQQKEIDELKDKNKWLARYIAGAAITAVIGLVTAFLKFNFGI